MYKCTLLTACDKRVDDRFVLDFPYGIAIANPFLIADDSDQILGHRLGYVYGIHPSGRIQCYALLSLLSIANAKRSSNSQKMEMVI